MKPCPRCKRVQNSTRFRYGDTQLPTCRRCYIEINRIKYCSSCKKWKSVDAFPETKAPSPDGRDCRCGECKKAEAVRRAQEKQERCDCLDTAFRGIDIAAERYALRVSANLLTKKRWNAASLREAIQEAEGGR